MLVNINLFATGEDVSPKKITVKKAATIKTFGYSPLNKDPEVQTDISKKQFQGLDKVGSFDKEDEKAMKTVQRVRFSPQQ